MPESKAPDGDRKAETPSVRARERDALNTVTDECSRQSRAFLYAGLESVKQMGDVMSTFVDKTYERNDAKRKDSAFKQMASLPWDMTEAFFDAVDESVNSSEKVIDKFYERYKGE